MTAVLIVDDDVPFRTTVVRSLVEGGFDVSEAGDVDQALTALGQTQVDVLLTDLRLGARDGIDLLQDLKRSSPHTRPILMSAYATARDDQVATKMGAVKVLCKPFTPAELLAAVRQAAECETGFRGSVFGLSLTDVLQMFHYARRSVVLSVHGGVEGSIYVSAGDVVHATAEGEQGRPALRKLLASSAGSLQTSVLPADVTRTIEASLETLLLDSLRQIDEQALPVDAVVESESVPGDTAGEVVNTGPRIQLDEQSSTRVELMLAEIRRGNDCVACALVDLATGQLLLGDVNESAGPVDLDQAARGYSEMLRVERRLMAGLDPDDPIDDVVIALPTQYHVIRPLASGKGLLLLVRKTPTNLAVARSQLRRMAARLNEVENEIEVEVEDGR